MTRLESGVTTPSASIYASIMPAISSGSSTRRPTARSGIGKAVVRMSTVDAGAVRVLAQDVVTAQARLGDRVALGRREVARLLPEKALIGVAEERDDGVIAKDRHVSERLGRVGVCCRGAVRVHDALDLLGDEVLRERAAAVRLGVGLGPERWTADRRRGRRGCRRPLCACEGPRSDRQASPPSPSPRSSRDESVRMTVA